MELAEDIHRDDGKGKREKKDRRGSGVGGGVGVGNKTMPPALR